MKDVFIEQLVKKQIKPKDIVKKGVILLIAFVATFIMVVLLPILSFMFLILFIFLSYTILSTLRVEYEYILTNDNLDIDIIYNKNKRKNLFSNNIRDIEIMANINDTTNNEKFNNLTTIKDFSSGNNNENTYIFITRYKGDIIKVIIEPNDVFLSAMSKRLSKTKLYINKLST